MRILLWAILGNPLFWFMLILEKGLWKYLRYIIPDTIRGFRQRKNKANLFPWWHRLRPKYAWNQIRGYRHEWRPGRFLLR